jgi:transcriptional regulator with XRE-family HTH domain
MPTVADVILRELLAQHGVTTIDAFRRQLGVTKQYGWLLWHGKVGLSGEMIRRIHVAFDIPLEQLVQVERETPRKRPGPPPRQSPPESPDAPAC